MPHADNHEVLEALHALADHVDTQFNELKSDIGGVKGEIGTIKGDIRMIKAKMVTKDYLDEKLGDLRGDMVLMMRKEDRKVEQVIYKLKEKNVFNEADVDDLMSVNLFPRSAV